MKHSWLLFFYYLFIFLLSALRLLLTQQSALFMYLVRQIISENKNHFTNSINNFTLHHKTIGYFRSKWKPINVCCTFYFGCACVSTCVHQNKRSSSEQQKNMHNESKLMATRNGRNYRIHLNEWKKNELPTDIKYQIKCCVRVCACIFLKSQNNQSFFLGFRSFSSKHLNTHRKTRIRKRSYPSTHSFYSGRY